MTATHSPTIREIPVALGMIVYAYRCDCGAQGYAATEAEIWAAHPLPTPATREQRQQRAPLRIVVGKPIVADAQMLREMGLK